MVDYHVNLLTHMVNKLIWFWFWIGRLWRNM